MIWLDNWFIVLVLLSIYIYITNIIIIVFCNISNSRNISSNNSVIEMAHFELNSWVWIEHDEEKYLPAKVS